MWQCVSGSGAVTSGHNFLSAGREQRRTLPLMTNAPHILIIDDHREIRELIGRALTREGFRISAAADGGRCAKCWRTAA
jgi:PleD family two-component response regulator